MADTYLKIKMINSIYKYFTAKQETLPLYHGNDVPDFVKADADDGLERDKLKNHDISENAVFELIDRLSTDRRINIAGFGIMLDGKLVAEHYLPPFSSEYRHVSFSMCKSVIGMAVGIAVSKELFSVNDKLSEIFPEHNGIFMKKGIKEITVKNLLTMTSGVKFDEVSSYFSYDWCKSFMGSDTGFEPGTSFSYNSLNTYMLAAVIKRKSGMNVMDFLQENLFNSLGIHDITWDKCPLGIEKGGWGMKLSLPDMLKLGQLYLNKGVWNINGRDIRLLDKSWIDESLKCHVALKDKRFVKGYGYQIWLMNDGAYLFNGVFGQNVYINYKRNMVIATTASAHEFFPDGRLVEEICSFAKSDRNFCRDSSLGIFRHRISVMGRRIFAKKPSAYDIRELLNPYFDIKYKFQNYASSILPLTSQVIYSNFLTGIEWLCIKFNNNRLMLNICDGGNAFLLAVGYADKQPFEYQVLNINGKKMPAAVSGRVLFDEDERMLLKINITFLEEIGSKILKIYFNREGIELKADETPDMLEFADKLLGEELMRRTKKLGKLTPPDYLKYKIQTILTPDVKGQADE